VSVAKTNYVLMFREQNTGQDQNFKIANKSVEKHGKFEILEGHQQIKIARIKKLKAR
jgi:hypothetical protein